MTVVSAEFENGTLVLSVHGRLDTNSAPEAETFVREACAQYETEHVLLDMEDAEYVSSAGLRVVLRLRREKPALRVVNVQSEVYEIFDMTGFTEMMPVEKAYRRLSVEGCPVIGKGAKGTVYRYSPDTVVKVYRDPDSLPDIRRERELARRAFVLGIPTAISYDIVKVGESYGSVFELLDARSYSMLIAEDPENLDRYVRDFAKLLRQIHATAVRPEDMPDVREQTETWTDAAAPYLSAEDSAKLVSLIAAVPETGNMLHCDYHTNNVMMQNGETLLIDMDTLCRGNPVFELANVFACYVCFTELDPENVEAFMGFPRETAFRVWERFLRFYLDTEDEETLRTAEQKIRLLGWTRTLRHITRHSASPEALHRSTAYCAERIHTLLEEIHTLEI